MSATSTERGSRDDDRVDPAQESQCKRWARKLGVTASQLKAAVNAVGPRAEDVERYLRDHAKSARSS